MQYETLQKILDKMELNRTTKQIEQQRYLRISVRDDQDDDNLKDTKVHGMRILRKNNILEEPIKQFNESTEEHLRKIS